LPPSPQYWKVELKHQVIWNETLDSLHNELVNVGYAKISFNLGPRQATTWQVVKEIIIIMNALLEEQGDTIEGLPSNLTRGDHHRIFP
jgi:hypothetical protein